MTVHALDSHWRPVGAWLGSAGPRGRSPLGHSLVALRQFARRVQGRSPWAMPPPLGGESETLGRRPDRSGGSPCSNTHNAATRAAMSTLVGLTARPSMRALIRRHLTVGASIGERYHVGRRADWVRRCPFYETIAVIFTLNQDTAMARSI